MFAEQISDIQLESPRDYVKRMVLNG
ncbi:unnamed protein product, partial [Allacma fusca]